jgi:hypothetical protein
MCPATRCDAGNRGGPAAARRASNADPASLPPATTSAICAWRRRLDQLPEHYEAVLRAKHRRVVGGRHCRGVWAKPKAIESLLTRACDAFRTAFQRMRSAARALGPAAGAQPSRNRRAASLWPYPKNHRLRQS